MSNLSKPEDFVTVLRSIESGLKGVDKYFGDAIEQLAQARKQIVENATQANHAVLDTSIRGAYTGHPLKDPAIALQTIEAQDKILREINAKNAELKSQIQLLNRTAAKQEEPASEDTNKSGFSKP